MKPAIKPVVPTYEISVFNLPTDRNAIPDMIAFGDQIVDLYPDLTEAIKLFYPMIPEIKAEGIKVMVGPGGFLFGKVYGYPTCCSYITLIRPNKDYKNTRYLPERQEGLGYTRCPLCLANDRHTPIASRLVPWEPKIQSHPYFAYIALRNHALGYPAIRDWCDTKIAVWEAKFDLIKLVLEENGHEVKLKENEMLVGYVPVLIKKRPEVSIGAVAKAMIINLDTYQSRIVAKFKIVK